MSNKEVEARAIAEFRSKVLIAEDAVVYVNPNIYVVLTALEARILLTMLEAHAPT